MAISVSGPRKRRLAKLPPSVIVVVEDNAARSHRRSEAGVTRPGASPLVLVRLHRVGGRASTLVAQRGYRTGGRKEGGRRVSIALALIDRAREADRRPIVVVAGTSYGLDRLFLEGLIRRGLDFATEIRPSTQVARAATWKGRPLEPVSARTLLRGADWKRFRLAVPGASAPVEYHAADLGNVLLSRAVSRRLIAAQTGGIRGLHPGTAFVITSRSQDGLKHILESAA